MVIIFSFFFYEKFLLLKSNLIHNRTMFFSLDNITLKVL